MIPLGSFFCRGSACLTFRSLTIEAFVLTVPLTELPLFELPLPTTRDTKNFIVAVAQPMAAILTVNVESMNLQQNPGESLRHAH